MNPQIPRRWEFLLIPGALISVAIASQQNLSQPEPPIDSFDSDGAEVMLIRSEVKRRLAAEVASGQRSLFEAAALFAALDRLAAAPITLRRDEADQSAPEPACRQVLQWVAEYHDGSDRTTTLARLRSELQTALEKSGGLRLPDANIMESIERLLADAREQLPRLKEGKR